MPRNILLKFTLQETCWQPKANKSFWCTYFYVE